MLNEITAAHTQSAQEVITRLEVEQQTGLSWVRAKERYYQNGPNLLPEEPARPAWSVFLIQFRSMLILILLAAVLLSALIGNIKDAVVILVVVLINTSMGFYQEYRAERSLAALKEMLPVKTHVKRDAQKIKIPAEQLVAGDIVLLEAGDRVPADGRLLIAAGLEIDESALTGESQPVVKDSSVLSIFDAVLSDRINMVYMNTILTKGRAEFVVTATGTRTETGRLSEQLAATKESPTPLQIQLDILGKRLAVVALTLVGIMALLSLLRGTQLSHIILDAIALAVAAIPEGLPLVVTVTLSLGMRQMARQKAIVKRLASVETLGCTTVICSDKTGTLTLNQMTVRAFYYQSKHFNVSGEGYKAKGTITALGDNKTKQDLKPLMIALIVCNDSSVKDAKITGDPMEAALLILAEKGGVSGAEINQRLPRMAEIPFDAQHKFMATFHQLDDQVQLFVKGAPDALLPFCESCYANKGKLLSRVERDKIDAQYLAFAGDGLRGLLIATRIIPADLFNPSADLSEWIKELTFISLLGLQDPPRPEVKAAIAQCKQAGIAVKMITGDHQATGAAIAKELGIKGRAISGAELDLLDSAELAEMIDQTICFARVNPSQKVKIVRALQSVGHVVAMTGDGVNDAPALKSADIGVAMGITGTAVAKEAATMVLVDDNFATIVLAVQRGRSLYDNILKFVRFQLSTTIGAILTVFFAPLLGLPEPFTPIQILWIAIIMDGPPAVSLALDAGRSGIMSEPPRRRSDPILPASRLLKISAYGITMMVGTLAVLYFALQTGSEQRALTLAFTTFVLFQVFNVFNARNEFGSAFNPYLFSNMMLWASLIAVVVLQAIAVHWPPAMAIFAVGGMSFSDWGIAYGVAASILVLEEGRKLLTLFIKRLKH
ncbi:metal-transporting ATPase [Psychromonas sp. MB-3u-54]|uniref:cation-translocating P-type ATPase n=1 Tax=Psychromonas sp. MB-3u-54 TaxID=2058319 RepID=UPI000C3295B6|nr:HAD-IC family P-type ATPase [Psychromonas sp. MB-3u-54]PKH03296.1 metal-transporting ATPase [Psychromonas sp. MB-3u-54]